MLAGIIKSCAAALMLALVAPPTFAAATTCPFRKPYPDQFTQGIHVDWVLGRDRGHTGMPSRFASLAECLLWVKSGHPCAADSLLLWYNKSISSRACVQPLIMQDRSLISPQNSLFRWSRELASKRLQAQMVLVLKLAEMAEIRENFLYLPCLTGNLALRAVRP